VKLLNIPSAAKVLDLSRQRVHKLVKDGRIRLDPASGLISTVEIARFKKLKRRPGPPNGKRKNDKVKK
jgi:hypothetical protein